jgi:hypothetical protein
MVDAVAVAVGIGRMALANLALGDDAQHDRLPVLGAKPLPAHARTVSVCLSVCLCQPRGAAAYARSAREARPGPALELPS